jgi:hypothetical protein
MQQSGGNPFSTKKSKDAPNPNKNPCVMNIAGTDFVDQPAVNSPRPRNKLPSSAV